MTTTDSTEFAAALFESQVLQVLKEHSQRLTELSQEIWKNPELAFEEFHAVALLTKYLTDEGFSVTRPYCGMETAFLAEFQTPNLDSLSSPTVAVLCEYDSLPEMGHACGHNLISEAGLGTFLSVCAVMKSMGLPGRVICMGTPAEEGGGGKVHLLRKGAFNNVDFAMMVHPAPVNILELAILGIERLTVEYFGTAAHASCMPWDGVNALDAAIAAYNNIAMLRQQLKPAHQIHINIMNGGAQPNVIPDHTKSVYYLRAPTIADMQSLKVKIQACLEAAAIATGCRIELHWNTEDAYGPLLSNKTMLTVYGHYAKKHGMFFPELRPSYGSTDMGNVSTHCPSIHPAFAIPGMQMIHSKEFQVLAGQPEAHKAAQRAAVAMAMTALELFVNTDFRHKVKAEFDEALETFVGCKKLDYGLF